MHIASGLNGILLVDKPAGWTSHDVVAKCRGLLGERRIGHTGTLDPMATGLLVLCIGSATRLVEYMTAHDKRYRGEIKLGLATTTDDSEGEVVAIAPVPALGDGDIADLEREFSGVLQQRPPAFSAISIDGKRAYARARKGEAVDLPERRVTVHSLSLQRNGADRLDVELDCGPGTYVRSLARDIGGRLGCGGHLTQLRRTAVGAASIKDAWTLPEIEALARGGQAAVLLQRADEGIVDLPAAIVAPNRAAQLRQGSRIEAIGEFSAAPVVRIYDAAGAFNGVGSVDDSGQIRPLKVLNSG